MQVSWLAFAVLLFGVASVVTIGAFIAYGDRPSGSMWLGVPDADDVVPPTAAGTAHPGADSGRAD